MSGHNALFSLRDFDVRVWYLYLISGMIWLKEIIKLPNIYFEGNKICKSYIHYRRNLFSKENLSTIFQSYTVEVRDIYISPEWTALQK